MHTQDRSRQYALWLAIAGSLAIVAAAVISSGRGSNPRATGAAGRTGADAPDTALILPVRWNDTGAKLVSVGVIDPEEFESRYRDYPELASEMRRLLFAADNGDLRITRSNAGLLLNLLWALGLGNRNDILAAGPLGAARYGGADGFASTAGWTLAQGEGMDHYSRHPFVVLTPGPQQLVERVSKNVYRPCCNNPAHLPDCNHGMAMLGLLELMASQGVSEEKMYKTALQVNALWFPDTYLAIAQYLASRGIHWDEADPKEILGADYSSGSGYRRILSHVAVPAQKSGGSCGV